MSKEYKATIWIKRINGYDVIFKIWPYYKGFATGWEVTELEIGQGSARIPEEIKKPTKKSVEDRYMDIIVNSIEAII